jgi:hypothetical protein
MINNDLRSLWEQRLAEYENSGKPSKRGTRGKNSEKTNFITGARNSMNSRK